MKKIFLIVLMLITMVNVQALENNTESVKKYKYYRLNKVTGPYVFKDELTDEYPLIDENVFEKTDLSEILLEKPEEKEGRTIYEYEGFHYQEALKVNKIIIKSGVDMSIANLSFFDENKQVNYKESNEILKFKDKEEKTFNLNDGIYPKEFYLKAQFDENNTNNYITITFYCDDTMIITLATNYAPNSTLNIRLKSFGVRNKYKDTYSLEEKQTNDNVIFKENVKLYKYEDFKYQSYKLEKEYYDEYLENPINDYIYRDEEDFIEIKNDIVIPKDVVMPMNYINKKQVIDSNNINKKTSNETNNITKPISYQHTIKLKNNNIKTNNKNSQYLKIVILILLLLLLIKIKNKIKEYEKW